MLGSNEFEKAEASLPVELRNGALGTWIRLHSLTALWAYKEVLKKHHLTTFTYNQALISFGIANRNEVDNFITEWLTKEFIVESNGVFSFTDKEIPEDSEA